MHITCVATIDKKWIIKKYITHVTYYLLVTGESLSVRCVYVIISQRPSVNGIGKPLKRLFPTAHARRSVIIIATDSDVRSVEVSRWCSLAMGRVLLVGWAKAISTCTHDTRVRARRRRGTRLARKAWKKARELASSEAGNRRKSLTLDVTRRRVATTRRGGQEKSLELPEPKEIYADVAERKRDR